MHTPSHNGDRQLRDEIGRPGRSCSGVASHDEGCSTLACNLNAPDQIVGLVGPREGRCRPAAVGGHNLLGEIAKAKPTRHSVDGPTALVDCPSVQQETPGFGGSSTPDGHIPNTT